MYVCVCIYMWERGHGRTYIGNADEADGAEKK
jgi:hypothetical protein